MGELCGFIFAFFRGWKRKVGCMILLFACVWFADMMWVLAGRQSPEYVLMIIMDRSIVVGLLSFISGYLLFSKPRTKPNKPASD